MLGCAPLNPYSSGDLLGATISMPFVGPDHKYAPGQDGSRLRKWQHAPHQRSSSPEMFPGSAPLVSTHRLPVWTDVECGCNAHFCQQVFMVCYQDQSQVVIPDSFRACSALEQCFGQGYGGIMPNAHGVCLARSIVRSVPHLAAQGPQASPERQLAGSSRARCCPAVGAALRLLHPSAPSTCPSNGYSPPEPAFLARLHRSPIPLPARLHAVNQLQTDSPAHSRIAYHYH